MQQKCSRQSRNLADKAGMWQKRQKGQGCCVPKVARVAEEEDVPGLVDGMGGVVPPRSSPAPPVIL